MERRLAIYEKIKDSKLNKLTIKQGDVNVKLNLKKDLTNPNVEISDKALEMLEAYAAKNVNNNEKNNLENKSQPEPAQIEDQLSKQKEEIESPSKRVRFSFIPIEQQVENLIESNNQQRETDETNLFTVPFSFNHSQIEEPQKSDSVESQNQDKKEFKCRLCKLKISNEKALHEHVSRIHGGKGAFNMMKKESVKNSEEDYESSEIDDLDSQDETYLSSSSDSKRLKNDKPALPRPNVAIRVAKVAYYNSKGTINSNNPFKSNIFKNGGIRGNFFSQERLPLRSCKIKMKITSSLNQSSETPDDFLVNTHEIIKTDYQNPNKTVSVQSSKQDSIIDDLILNENDIKSFFKSLLDYIPISNVIRLDDLIKENETRLNDLKVDYNIDTIECIRAIYEAVLDSKQLGITLYDLKNETNKRLLKNNLNEIKMVLLKSLLDLLIKNHLIIPVGVVERVYVAHEFKKHWVIESYKNQRGRGYFNDEELIEEANEENNDNECEETENSSRSRSKNTKELSNDSKNFKPICIIPRPWRYIDGILNRPVLKKMLESVILYLKSNPSVSFNTISSHFCPVLQPIMTLELLEMLERLKCIKKLTLKKENPCDLFSDFNNGSYRIISEDQMNGNELHNYYLNQSSIFNIKKVFPN